MKREDMSNNRTIDTLYPENAHSMARGLGWFSIGLGLAEVLAPRALTRGLGMQGSEQLLQAYGLREIATGIGILSSEQAAPWIWGRLAGDALDIATLSTGLKEDNPKRDNVGIALAAVAGVTALDLVCGVSLARNSRPGARRPEIDYRNRVGFPKPPEQMRGTARDFEVPADMRTPEALRPFAIGSTTDSCRASAIVPSKSP